MAESMKAEKIAAAKKKLKQFQLKSKTETPVQHATPAQDTVNPNSLANGNSANDGAHCEPDTQPQLSGQQSADEYAGQTATLPANTVHIAAHIEASEPSTMPTAYVRPANNMLPESGQNAPLVDPAVAELAHSNGRLVAEVANLKHHIDSLSHSLQSTHADNQELTRVTANQRTEIDELRAALQRSADASGTAQKLQQELDSHVRTVNVLVGEKAELLAKLQSKEQSIKEYDAQAMELQGRLKASRFRVAELEKDINTMAQLKQTKSSDANATTAAQLDQLAEENKRLQKQCQDVCDDNTEHHHQLASKTKEIDSMKNALSAKSTELEMLRIRLQQLTDVDVRKVDEQLQQLSDQRESDTERQVIELQNMISEITNDRDRIEQQYKTYVKHLTDESAAMNRRIDELSRQNEKLAKREESLVGHTRDLEKQIQKQISTQQRLAALKDDGVSSHSGAAAGEKVSSNDEVVNALRAKLDECEKANAALHQALEDTQARIQTIQPYLDEKDSTVAALESELERMRADRPDMHGVLSEIESGKVAASRALLQNQELKEQLDEIQNAYIQVSNDKLELTNQLQSEQYTNQDVRSRFAGMETDLKALKEKLFFKDEEMIRLTHVNAELLTTVAKLTEKVHQRGKKHRREHQATVNGATAAEASPNDGRSPSLASDEPAEHTACDHHDDHDHSHTHASDNASEHNAHQHTHCSHRTNNGKQSTCSAAIADSTDTSDTVSVTSTINIATNEAMDKLQRRFTRTMTEIADLTEEKHRLEHLVTQLQNETETIGEYIALYQTQRRLLKQREIEKDIQLQRIAADREAMKERLQELNKLVELLLVQEGFPDAKQLMNRLRSTNKPEDTPADSSDGAAHADDVVIAEQMPGSDDVGGAVEKAPRAETQAVANKIINLLTEIKDKNLSNDLTAVNLNQCSCCSGKLEVV